MRIYLLNGAPPTRKDRFIREGRCMQRSTSWSSVWPPVTLARIAAMVRNGRTVRLLDGNATPIGRQALCDEIRAFAPDILIVNTGFPSIREDMETVRAVMKYSPGMRTVAFGPYFTLLDKQAMEAWPLIDFACVGEPEHTIGELIDNLESGAGSQDRIRGLLYRDNGAIAFSGPRDCIRNLDDLPLPARDLLMNQRYTLPHNGRPFTLIGFGRGCPYPCIFCIAPLYYGPVMRRHSADYVMQEIRECRERYGIRDFLLWGEMLTADREFSRDLCRRIRKEQPGMEWAATTRVDAVDPDTLRLMKAAGCQLLGLGIESGDQDILNRARKHITPDVSRRAVHLCREVGIRTMGHFIFGLPGETRATAEKTLAFIRELDLDYIQCYNAVPYPKTEFWEMAYARNAIRPAEWHEFDFGGRSVVRTEGMDPGEIDACRLKAYKQFYFRPKTIARQFRVLKPRRILKPVEFINWIYARGA